MRVLSGFPQIWCHAPLIGTLAWLVTIAAVAPGVGDLTLIDAMLALAVLVVVPAAVPLHPVGGGKPATIALLAALPVGPALLLDQGVLASVLVLPWTIVAGAGAGLTGMWWWGSGRSLREVGWAAAAAYLLVGAVWLLADRSGLEPAGFGPPLVQLTAIHFHYAGFVAAVLAGCAWRWSPGDRTAATALVLTVASPPIVAVGFTFAGQLQIAGAVLLTLGLWLLAWVTLRDVAPAVPSVPRGLLVVSALATLVPMVLAVQWAVGANLGTPALSIPAMVRAHGVVNAVAFALCGVAGWRLIPSHRRGPASGSPARRPG
jgi:hypothetical protein